MTPVSEKTLLEVADLLPRNAPDQLLGNGRVGTGGEVNPSPSETLAEAMRIVRGETMMLARKPHLVALAELNEKLTHALTKMTALFDGRESFRELCEGQRSAALDEADGILDFLDDVIKLSKVNHA